ncbi:MULTISPECIES: MDR family MFS transporter [Staphylococcus]|nr:MULTISPECIES: MDR family MFS transporter [Staphylococcus]UOC12991.1 multidrug efflux MFS transporter [Staphylococcus agnetis]
MEVGDLSEGLTTAKRNLIITIMLLSAFVAMLNQTILNTALPAMIVDLGIPETTAQWLITGFMLVNGIMIPLTAFLIDKYSTRQLYIFSMAAFLLGSVIAAMAPSFAVLMIARVIQAIGAGILLPLMQFIVFMVFPVEKRGFAMGLTGIVAQSAPAIGPTLTGVLIDFSSWHVPFIVVAVISLIAFGAGVFYVENLGQSKPTSLDKRSVVYSTVGFGLILYAFSIVGHVGPLSPLFIISLIVGIGIVAIFTIRQCRIDAPLLSVSVLKNKTFTLSAFASMMIYIGIVGPALLIPIYVQTGLGLSAFLSGLVILPGAVVNACMSTYTGKIYDRYGVRVLVIPGFILLIIMTILHIFLTSETPFWYVVMIYAIRMFSVALLMMPLNTAGLNALENKEVSHGNAIMNSLRIIAGAMGTAISITVLSIVSRNFMDAHGHSSKMMREATISGVDAAFIFTTVLIVIGFVLSLFIRETKQSPLSQS